MELGFLSIGLIAVIALFLLSQWVNVLREYERAVTFWLGRLSQRPKGPGLVFIFWPLERMVKISLRTVVLDVPAQDVITRDNVSVKVNAVLYFRVVDPSRAVVEVDNYLYATSQLAQTTLRAVLGRAQAAPALACRVADPPRAVVEVDNSLYATSQLAQTTLRAVLGQAELDELL